MAIDGGLRQLFRANLPHFDWCSIESGSTGGGIPDSNYATPGAEGWIEYKQTAGHAVTLRPEQIGWIMRRCRYGGTVHIAVRQHAPAGPRRAARDVLWLIPGHLAKAAKENGLKGSWLLGCTHSWHNGPANWDWRTIELILTAR